MKIKIFRKNKYVGDITALTTLEGGQIIATIKLNRKGKDLIKDPKLIPEVFQDTPSK